MIAISLWQPWASAIACGIKSVETRSWAAECIGARIAIHAAKKNTPELRAWWMHHVKNCDDLSMLNSAGFKRHGINDWCDLPFGAIVCTADLVAVATTERLVESGRVRAESSEFEWGNFAPIDDQSGRPRYGWILANVQPLPKPAPAKGWQGFFTWDPETNATVGLAPSWKGRAA